MRSLLLAGVAALALSFSGFSASAATLGEAARNANAGWAAIAPSGPGADGGRPVYVQDVAMAMTARPRDKQQASVTEAVATVASLAGAGLLFTLAAVGLRRVWTQDPIRDPLGEEPGFF